MSDHKERVIAEKKELDAKFDSLAAFMESYMFTILDIADRTLLASQACIMAGYSDVLERRIARFTV